MDSNGDSKFFLFFNRKLIQMFAVFNSKFPRQLEHFRIYQQWVFENRAPFLLPTL